MKRKVIPICGAVLLFLLAAAVLLYPLISSAYNEKHQSELLTTYMITLLTCHPYASGGKQRYVVYCEREIE